MSKKPARGHKVEDTIRKERTYDVLFIQRESGNGTKILGDSDISQTNKEIKRKKYVWLSGRLYIEG